MELARIIHISRTCMIEPPRLANLSCGCFQNLSLSHQVPTHAFSLLDSLWLEGLGLTADMVATTSALLPTPNPRVCGQDKHQHQPNKCGQDRHQICMAATASSPGLLPPSNITTNPSGHQFKVGGQMFLLEPCTMVVL